MSIINFIENLQSKPYEQRVKFLWIFSFIALVIVGGVWIGLSKMQSKINDQEEQAAAVSELEEDLEVAKEKFSEVNEELNQQIEKLQIPQNTNITTVTYSALSVDKDKLVVDFIATNPSLDILKFLSEDNVNITLSDGSVDYQPEIILTKGTEDPFPKKILSGESLEGFMVFAAPTGSRLTLNISDMYFENLSGERFSDNLEFTLGDRAEEVRGTSTQKLPRE